MKKNDLINLSEIIILLILPMLSPWINILYVILVLLIIFLSRYLRKESWSEYGFKPVQLKMLLLAALVGIVFGITDNYLIEPLVNRITGHTPDLSAFDNIKGNITGLFGMLAIGWIIGGFFEETFFRGYLLNRINAALNNRPYAKWAGIIVTSLSFAIAHSYQSAGGMIDTFYFSVIMCLLFYGFRKNVWYVILIHGFYDTIGIIFLFLGK